jgi:hypothetical protein
MKVRALRGVCIGVDQHLAAGDTADLEAAQVQFLASIGAVAPLPDEPVPAAPLPLFTVAASFDDPQLNPPPKPGKKEK